VSVPKFRILKSTAELIDQEVLGAVADEVTGKAKGRVCGDCRLCCKTLEVPELGKAPGKWCAHAYNEPGGAQCSIYDKRPESCRAFRCMWLDGFFEDRDRPDRSRLVVVEALDDAGNVRVAEHPQTQTPFPVLYAFEGQRGAVDGSGRFLAQTLLGSGVALAVMQEDGERIRELRFPAVVARAATADDVRVRSGETGGTGG
jgi:hypothetical protein